MKLRDLLFTGMDIPRQARKIINGFVNITEHMNEDELRAYEMGVRNALNVVKMLVRDDEHIVFHVQDYDVVEEFDLDELIEIVEEKEGC